MIKIAENVRICKETVMPYLKKWSHRSFTEAEEHNKETYISPQGSNWLKRLIRFLFNNHFEALFIMHSPP
jgi:hypothetical protein